MYRKAPERVEFATIFGGNRYLVPLNRGIATPVCALARNDSKERTNTNLSLRFVDTAEEIAQGFYGTKDPRIRSESPGRLSEKRQEIVQNVLCKMGQNRV